MIKLLFKLKRLLGFQVDMIVIVYVDCQGMNLDKLHETKAHLKEAFKTERILIVHNPESKVQIEYF